MVLDLSNEGLRSDMYANPHRERVLAVSSQDSPVMKGWSDASVRQKVAGIVDQVRLDLSQGHRHTAEELLRERFKASKIEVDDERVLTLAMSLRGTSGSTAHVEAHPRLTMNEYLATLEQYGYSVPQESYEDWAKKVEAYVEAGDANVSISIYAAVLQALGLLEGLGAIADIRQDSVGQSLASDNLPKRVRLKRPARPRNG